MRAVIVWAVMVLSLGVARGDDTFIVGPNGAIGCVFQRQIEDLELRNIRSLPLRPPKGCAWIDAGEKLTLLSPLRRNLGYAYAYVRTGERDDVYIIAHDEAGLVLSDDNLKAIHVDAEDALVTPERWAHKYIEITNLYVYWVDDDDVRIVSSLASPLAIFAQDAIGEPALLIRLRERCGVVKRVLTPVCAVTVRFVYSDFAADSSNGREERIVLAAKTVALYRPERR